MIVEHCRMRVTFVRVPDHERGWALVERDDGVVYRMDGGPVTADLPHDLVHFAVERTLGMGDGIWGAVAAGAVFRSMRHHRGRRPPHAAQRSATLIRANRDRLQRAELIAGFVQRIVAMAEPTPARIARFAKTFLATLPDGDLDLAQAAAAAAAVREMASRWRAISVGDQLSVDWPPQLRMQTTPLVRVERRRAGTRARRAPTTMPRRAG
jgi:hypothetical protein